MVQGIRYCSLLGRPQRSGSCPSFMRVLELRTNAGTSKEATATGFTVEVDDRQYLLTPRHVVEGLKDRDNIDIFVNGVWLPLSVRIFRCDDPVDIAVIIPPFRLTVSMELGLAETTGPLFGQDAYFLGFPFGIRGSGTIKVDESQADSKFPYPQPIVKRE